MSELSIPNPSYTPPVLETLSDFSLPGMVSSDVGFSMAETSCCFWAISSCLNSSWVLASRSFCLKEMSENMVAKVRLTSMAVLVLF